MLVRSARVATFAFLVIVSLLVPLGRADAASHTIRGRVTSYPTGLPIAGASVRAYANSLQLGSVQTAEDGSYMIVFDADSLPAGDGSVTASASGHVFATASFDPLETDTVKDFPLRIYGTVSGTLHHAVSGQPISNFKVATTRFDGTSWVAEWEGWANNGNFMIYSAMPDTYRICAGGIGKGFARQCFDGFDIHSTSDLAAATPVVVGDGAAVNGIHLHVSEGNKIRGTIRDERTMDPLGRTQLLMQLYDSLGNLLEFTSIDSDDAGAYELNGVPTGTFYVTASIPAGPMRGMRLYPGIECPADTCPSITNGQPLVVSSGGTVGGIDFSFRPMATLSGAVTDRATGQPVGGARVIACVLPILMWSTCYGATSDPGDGHYELDLDSRTYTLYANAPDSHANQIYPDTPCLDGFCGRNDSPQITVYQGDHLTGYDFALRRSSRISGTVREVITGEPLRWASVAVFDANYKFLWSVWPTSESGSYLTAKWPSGTYYLAAYYTWSSGCSFYLDRPCPPSASDPIAIAAVAPTPVVVADGEVREGIDIRIPSSDRVFTNGFD